MFLSDYSSYYNSYTFTNFTPIAFGGGSLAYWPTNYHDYPDSSSSNTSPAASTKYTWSETASDKFYETIDELEEFLIEKCSRNILGIIHVARLSQKQTQIIENEEIVTPYEMLNNKAIAEKSVIKKNKNSSNKLTKTKYMEKLVEYTGLLAPYFYLLSNNNTYAKEKMFFNATLDLLAKVQEDDSTNIGKLLEINLHLSAFNIDSDVYPEFHDLMLAFTKLSNKEICQHYHLYKFIINKELELINLDRSLSIKRLIETSKNDKIIIQAQGKDVWLTVSDEVTQQLGLKPGCRISCIYGLGFFLGVEEETGLWFLMDHNPEPNYWKSIKTKDDLVKHLLIDLTKPTLSTSGPALSSATKLVQSMLDVIQTNAMNVLEAKFIKQNDYHHARFQIQSAILKQCKASFLDEITTEFGTGTIIGEYNNKLWYYLHDDNNFNNFYNLSATQISKCKISKRSQISYEDKDCYELLQKHDERIISSKSFDVLSSFISSLLQKNHNSIKIKEIFFFQNINNIFLDLHVYLKKNQKKSSHATYQKKLAIFYALVNFLKDCQNYTQPQFKTLLDKNFQVYKPPKGLKTAVFFNLIKRLRSYNKNQLVAQYKKYISILQDAEDFIKLTKDPQIINKIKLRQIVFTSRDGTLNEIDISNETLNKFGINFYQQFTYRDKESTVVGIHNGRFCYYSNVDQEFFSLNTLSFDEPIKYNLDVNLTSNSNLQQIRDEIIRPDLLKPNNSIEFDTKVTDFRTLASTPSPFIFFAKKTKNDEEGFELKQHNMYKQF